MSPATRLSTADAAPARAAVRARAVALTAGELAWIAALPCAVVTYAAIRVLGPVLGRAFFDPGPDALWPHAPAFFVIGKPEPTKHGCYVAALLGPLLLTAAVLLGSRRPLRLRAELSRALVTASQLLLAAGLAAATLAQWHVAIDGVPPRWRIFTPRTLAAALLLTGALLAGARATRLSRLRAALRSEAPWARAACLLAAALATVAWLLPGIITDATIARGPFLDLVPWETGDTYAILDGRTPLVDFHPIYGHLWAYVAAVPMALLGATLSTFSVAMTTISAVALLLVYATLRRLARGAPLALALYLPFLATSMFEIASIIPWRLTNAGVYSVWPMRYAGPALLAWLTARSLDGAAPRRTWPLFVLAGLVVVNNVELGAGALAGTFLALAFARPGRRALLRLAATAAAGLLGAALLVSLLTLVRAGALPRFGLLLEFPRVFGVLGLVAIPMRAVGFHLVIYATLCAALALAAVRVVRREPDVLLTGMLAWSGVFGLAAGSYFIGRSDALKLAALLPAWSLALTLLLLAAARELSARGWRRPAPAELLVLFGFAASVCSLAQAPAPWRELSRLGAASASQLYAQPAEHRFVARFTRPGERVMILLPLGHRIAYDLGLVNVSPYGFMDEVAERGQMRTAVATLRSEHARKLFAQHGHFASGHRRMLEAAGFSRRASEAATDMWAAGP